MSFKDKVKAFMRQHANKIRAFLAFVVVYVVEVSAKGDLSAMFNWDARTFLVAFGAAVVAFIRAGDLNEPVPPAPPAPPSA